MGFFDKLGSNLIADKIRSEALKAIDQYVESAVINALLPQGTGAQGDVPSVKISADLVVTLKKCKISYVQHMGSSSQKELELPEKIKDLALSTVLAAARPASMNEAETVTFDDFSLTLSGKAAGVSFRQMMMGVGATIDGVDMELTVTGKASAQWLGQKKIEEVQA